VSFLDDSFRDETRRYPVLTIQDFEVLRKHH
jgi:hypothetical protein